MYQETSDVTASTCRYFLRHRRCGFGDQCKFSHIIAENTQPGDGAVSADTPAPAAQDTDNNPFQTPAAEDHGALSEPADQPAVTSPDTVTERPVCQFYARRGYCRYGRGCRYVHVRRPRQKKPAARKQEEEENEEVNKDVLKLDEVLGDTHHEDTEKEAVVDTEGIVKENTGDAKKVKPVCKFYRRGYCAFGRRCRFLHGTQKPSSATAENTEEKLNKPAARPGLAELASLTDEAAAGLRETELSTLRRLYPLAENMAREDRAEKMKFVFRPSDPDWPYDVRTVTLQVTVPRNYPRKCLKVRVMEDDRLPEPVQRCCQSEVSKFIVDRFEKLQGQGQVELALRPFLKWLDRTLLETFTSGLQEYKRYLVAKASGLEFISAEKLRGQFVVSGDSDDSDEEDEEFSADDDEDDDVTDDESEDEETDDESEDESDEGDRQHTALDPVKKGTEVKLISLQLCEQTASLHMQKLRLVIQCSRCANTQDLPLTAGRPFGAECSRCHANIFARLRPALAHQYSSVIGYLDLLGGAPFDMPLVDCEYLVACLRCDREMPMQGLSQGAPKDSWCMGCHGKLRLGYESVRFTQVSPSDCNFDPKLVERLQIQAEKKKLVKDPAIQLGKPLPNNGTCKHYKKSYRWLRFPCCGKAYPCDVCHDDKESDHEMKYANRMICGWCCKEQGFAVEKPCIACRQHMTYKATSYWEGGKGCRNKITMSRHDNHKYADTNKTVSKKTAAKKQSKKTTKVRHA